MRADRLLSLLMLLQLRGRTTALKLAEELEVSERTIYRDMQALSAAGVPVYTERGPGGGCELLFSYRTTLTGFTDDELRALFMLNIPSPLAELGMDQPLRSAMLKLAAALPSARRDAEARTRQRIYLDSSPQVDATEPIPHLQTIYRAVWEDRKLEIAYRFWFGGELRGSVDPYGLVASGGVWHLVYVQPQRIRAIRVTDLSDVRLLDETFTRPADFDLAEFWSHWSADDLQNRAAYPVIVRVSSHLMPWLPQLLGADFKQAIEAAPPPDTAGWRTLTLAFDSLETARARLLAFGGGLEVLEPQALRLSMADFGRQIVSRYGS